MSNTKNIFGECGLFSHIGKSEPIVYTGRLSNQDIDNLIGDLCAPKKGEKFLMYGGTNTVDLIQAELSGDENKIKEVRDRIDREHKERLYAEYKQLHSMLSKDDYLTFTLVDDKFRRFSSQCAFGSYVWYDYGIKVPFHVDGEEEASMFPLHIGYRVEFNAYCLYIDWSDDSGYETGTEVLVSNIKPQDILVEISKFENKG